jgi:hypothetical protein
MRLSPIHREAHLEVVFTYDICICGCVCVCVCVCGHTHTHIPAPIFSGAGAPKPGMRSSWSEGSKSWREVSPTNALSMMGRG